MFQNACSNRPSIAVLLPLLLSGASLIAEDTETLDGYVRVAVNTRHEVVVFMDVDGEGCGGATDRVFVFAPVDPDPDLDGFDASATGVHVEFLLDRLTIRSSGGSLLVDVALDATIGSASWIGYSTGDGLSRSAGGDWPSPSQMTPGDGCVVNCNDATGTCSCSLCTAGGPGSTGCAVNCDGASSGATCGAGHYCCGCCVQDKPCTYCVKNRD